MNEIEKAIKIIKDKRICEFCEDCGEAEVCLECKKVTPVTVDDLNMFYETTIRALEENQEYRKQHLCSSCSKRFETCDGSPEFGNGIGNDNVFRCGGYKRR